MNQWLTELMLSSTSSLQKHIAKGTKEERRGPSKIAQGSRRKKDIKITFTFLPKVTASEMATQASDHKWTAAEGTEASFPLALNVRNIIPPEGSLSQTTVAL